MFLRNSWKCCDRDVRLDLVARTGHDGTAGERRSRLSDIAHHAGVSEATVSRVLNDKPGVAAATRATVLTAVDVLGYDRPSRLRRKGASLVGLIVPELTNPVFPAFAQIIETSLARRGLTPVLCTQTTDGIHEDEYVDMLLDRGVAGLICISGQHADTHTSVQRYRRLRDQGLPLVLVNGYREGVDAAFISGDDVAAMDLAVTHLAELGHTTIGLAVGQERYVPVQRKMAGFAAAMATRVGREDVGDLMVNTLFTLEGGASAAQILLERGATAIVCGSDPMALGAIRQVRALGMSVPGDVSVIGYDDSALMGYTDPPLTTVRQRVQAMSQAAAQSLVEIIGGEAPPATELLFAPELVVRRSTGSAPS